MTETTATVDTLAADLQTSLGGGWTVIASFDQIIAVTPLCDRIMITPIIYSWTDVRWMLTPERRHVPPMRVQEIPGDVTNAVVKSLRSLSYQHHAPTASA